METYSTPRKLFILLNNVEKNTRKNLAFSFTSSTIISTDVIFLCGKVSRPLALDSSIADFKSPQSISMGLKSELRPGPYITVHFFFFRYPWLDLFVCSGLLSCLKKKASFGSTSNFGQMASHYPQAVFIMTS